MREKGLKGRLSRESGNLLKKIGYMLPVRADSEQDSLCLCPLLQEKRFFLINNDITGKRNL